MREVPTPECDRMLVIHGESQIIGEFLDWLRSAGVHRMRWVETDEEQGWVEDGRSIERLLADYYDVDLDKVEAEKQALLAAIREAS